MAARDISPLNLGVVVLCTLTINALIADAVKFPKDQRMDMPFPHQIDLPISPELPIGHLRPLGRQHRSEGEVAPGDQTAWNCENPALFRALLPNDTRYNIWPSSVNASEISEESQRVMVAKRHRDGRTFYENMDLSTFLDNYSSEDWLIEQILDNKSLQNIKMPEGFECLTKNLSHVSSSLTSGLTSDNIKVSILNKLQCVLKGRRDYIVLSNEDTTPNTITKHSQAICGTEATVDMNPESINVFDNIWIATTPWNHASLFTGDCILLPADTVFHTMSYSECETVSFNWVVRTNCEKLEKEESAKPVVPVFCSNKNNKVQFCDCDYHRSETEWQQLLMELANKNGVASKSCLSTLADSEETVKEIYEILYTERLAGKEPDQLSTATLNKIKNLVCPEKPTHKHDEL